MRFLFIILLLASIPFHGSTQNSAEDSVVLVQTAEWLCQKLTYNYYNADDEEWWSNRFDFDPLTLKVTVRNISSERLGSIQDRTHVQRTFYFGDLNPYNIYIDKTSSNSGRLVTGKTIRVGTYQQAKAIKQMKNGSVPSTSSFLYFSIPSAYEDSTANYAEGIVEKFEKAILLAIEVYPTGGFETDASQLFNILEDDRFISETNGNIEISKIYDDVLELNHYNQDNQLVQRAFIKKRGDQTIHWVGIKPLEAIGNEILKFENDHDFILSNDNMKLYFVNKHEFHLIEDGEEIVFIRDNSYEKGRPYYR